MGTAADTPHELPKPIAAHERLRAFVGTWHGDEAIHLSPFTHEQRGAGTFVIREALDGFFVTIDYEQRAGGDVVMRGHGVIGFDTKQNLYTLHWFDTFGSPPAGVGRAWRWEDGLTFEQDHGHHTSRTSFQLRGDVLVFVAAMDDGGGFTPLVEGRYTRDAPSRAVDDVV